jgi:hypothetical protein
LYGRRIGLDLPTGEVCAIVGENQFEISHSIL